VGISVRNLGLVGLFLLLTACAGVFFTITRAGSDEPPHCDRIAAERLARGRTVTGSGARVVVIGDSYSAGWGLDDPARSWPSELTGAIHVDAFSGSGFSAGASSCDGVAYADRAARAVAGGADLVVVQGGLNDTDQPETSLRIGVRRLLTGLRGHEVVLVGPPFAPSRIDDVERVDALLAAEAARAAVRYLPMLDLELDYQDDDLHLTEDGHRVFGQAVSRALAD
jgi:acyl-CoA thioesterase-1